MASVEAYTSLKTAVQNGVTPIPVYDFDDIEPDAQQGTDPFHALEEVADDEQLVGFGGNLCHREIGVMRVHAFSKAPVSSSAARQQAENVQNYLRSQILSNGLRIVEITPPTPGTTNDGLWTVYSISVTYALDTVRAHPTPI